MSGYGHGGVHSLWLGVPLLHMKTIQIIFALNVKWIFFKGPLWTTTMANLLISTYSTEIYLHIVTIKRILHTHAHCHSRTHAHTHTNIYIMIKDLLVSLYTQFQKDHNKRMPHKF